ncbi:MAG TPA: glycosyltransferase family 2 protein [Candidatus Dormibacteraeota bacterium]|nr:glycosyltransferase family 2 protein [Candidatus Dormibacteraeota bacterium]
MSETVSACLIVRNEEGRLPGALASVSWCDEIVVVDSGSRDRTREIAREAGAKVIENEWPGFAIQRNVAIDNATSDWILEVDADERITRELASEIQAFLQDPPEGMDVTAVPRYDLFLGGRLGPSAKHPIYSYRFFRRGVVRHDESRMVHEGLAHRGRVWAFEGEFEHIFAANAREAIGDMLSYTKLEASLLGGGYSAADYVRGIFMRPSAKFLYRTFVDGGWRDGWRGLAFISLWCTYDALVWARHLLRRNRAPRAGHMAGGAHFGRWSGHVGVVRIVALAQGEIAARRALKWLREAANAGADVALVTDSLPSANGIPRVRHVERITPLRVLRALDAETRVRAVDAIVPMGKREKLMLRCVPKPIGPMRLDQHMEPVEAERVVRKQMRDGEDNLAEVA